MSKKVKDIEKEAAEHALYEFRKQYAKNDLEKSRNVLLAILNDPEASNKEKIDAARELNKMHGGHTPSEKPAPSKKEIQQTEAIEVPEDFISALNKILGVDINEITK